MAERKEMPLWGWGDAEHSREVPLGAAENLSGELGFAAGTDVGARRIEDFDLAAPVLSPELLERLSSMVPTGSVSTEPWLRLLRAAGKSYADAVRMRAGRPGDAPDAVVTPGEEEEIAGVLQLCSELRIAVVPFGGGTSVVGGLSTIRKDFIGSISLDLGALSGLVSVDKDSLLATFRPGTKGPEAEALLKPYGLTVGHFPQSFEYASIGGFVATRSAGQSSTGYGRIDRNVMGLKVTTPTGRIELAPMPGSAAGPDLRQLLIGSEGTLGVIDEVTLRVHPSPASMVDRAWIAPDFETGREVLRLIEQDGCAPDVARLSDERETEVNLLLAGDSLAVKLLRRYLRLRRRSNGCLMITCFEGESVDVARRSQRASALMRKHHCLSLGSRVAKGWRKGRFAGPYIRDSLMDGGLFVETLETASNWSNLGRLYDAVRTELQGELEKEGGTPVVMCHVSHLYPTGASLYFTFAGKQPYDSVEERLALWQRVKGAACDAIRASGGTITHHHAVGTDHAPWLEDEIGAAGIRLLKAAKAELDPVGIMNPGRLMN